MNNATGRGFAAIVPPPAKRGDKSAGALYPHVDWLSVTVSDGQLWELLGWFERLLSPFGDFEDRKLLRRFRYGKLHISGAAFVWGNANNLLKIDFPGAICTALGERKIRDILHYLLSKGCKITRLDLAVDDYEKRITPRDCADWVRAGTLCGFQKKTAKFIDDLGSGEGCTLKLGKRGKDGSGKYVRIYEKWAESRGEIDCNRFELEASGDVAQQIGEALSADQGKDSTWYASQILRAVFGSFDFRKKARGGNMDRSIRVPRWSAFLGSQSVARFNARRAATTLERTLDNLGKQYAALLCAIRSKAGFYWEEFCKQIALSPIERGSAFNRAIRRIETARSLGLIQTDSVLSRWQFESQKTA